MALAPCSKPNRIESPDFISIGVRREMLMLKMTEEGRDRVASLGFAEMIRALDKYQMLRRVNQDTRERMFRMIFAKVLTEPDRVPELLTDEYTDELRQFAEKYAAEIDVAVGKCLYTNLIIH